jgi:hypothetical protein
MYRNHTAPDVFDRIGERLGSLTEDMDIRIRNGHSVAPVWIQEEIASDVKRAHPPDGQVAIGCVKSDR